MEHREVCPSGCHLITFPNPSWVDIPAFLTPHHTLASDLRQPGPRKRLNLWMLRYLGTWSVVQMGNGSQYWQRLKKHPRSSADIWQQLSYSNPHNQHIKIPSPSWANIPAQSTLHNYLALDLEQPQEGKNMTLDCIWVESQMPTQAMHKTSESTQSTLTTATPLLWGKGLRAGRRKNTLKENIVNLSRTLRASVPPIWGADLNPDRKWQPLSRQKVLPHTLGLGFSFSNTNHTPSQCDSSQHTLGKDVAGIHNNYSHHNQRTWVHQVYRQPSHIKIALQDHNR